MDDPTYPLTLTKLRVPAERPRNLPRAHLVETLAAEIRPSLILACAPAGYGKTTLLAEWAHSLRKNGVAVAWYALDASDDQPTPFGAYLAAGLIQALGPIAGLNGVAQQLRASPDIDLQRIMPSIINAVLASGQECGLVIDDYHLISSPEIHTALAYLVDHLPENLRVAIGSRSVPPLPLARLRARGQLLEIRSASLRFTEQETAQFLNGVMRLDLSAAGVAALVERTEGWAAGLQLAALSLAGRGEQEPRGPLDDFLTSADFASAFHGGHRYLVEYLLEEVINRLPEQAQWFLLATSILERMCAPLCDNILGQGYQSEAILKQLEQANLFIVPLDDQGCWYRYHHLFRQFLFEQLKKIRPGLIPALHRAACEWLAAHANLREAAAHAFQARDWEYAAAFVEQHSFTLITHSEISTLYEWCSAFPEEVMQRHPALCILQCYAPAFHFRRQDRAKIEARLLQAEKAIAALEDRQYARGLTENAMIVSTFLAMAPDPAADPRQHIAAAQSLLERYPEGEPGQFSGLLIVGYAQMALNDAQAAQAYLEKARQSAVRGRLFFGVVESTFHLARLAHSRGQLTEATEIITRGRADIAALLARPEQELPAVGCLDIALGCVLLEQDRLAEAGQHLLHGLDLIGWGMPPYYQMTGLLGLFRLRQVQGRADEALACLARLEEAWPDIAFCARGLRVTHALRSGAPDPGLLAEAAAWWRDFSAPFGGDIPTPGAGPLGAAEIYYCACLAWVRCLIAAGSAQPARAILDRLSAPARANGLTTRVIELALLEAELEAADIGESGDPQPALEALERALALAQPAGFVRIFDQGPALTRLLVEAARRGLYSAYTRRTLAAIGAPEASAAQPERVLSRPNQGAALASGERLSLRELEILQLMACGASNQFIADHLVITVGTVKSHINHILGKLDARNRTEAVSKARALGLLE